MTITKKHQIQPTTLSNERLCLKESWTTEDLQMANKHDSQHYLLL